MFAFICLQLFFESLFLPFNTAPANLEVARKQKDLAVFIAIQDYQQWPKLKHPISEVTNLAATLHDTYDFDTLVLRNPSKKAIFAKLEELIQKQFEPDAQLFLFFSGHGDFREDTNEGYFIPVDAALNDPYQDSYLSYQILRRRIDGIGCNHILLSIDACYSGTFDDEVAFRGAEGTWGKPETTIETQRELFINEQLKLKSRLFAASGGKERTPDKSQFVQKYLEALATKGGEYRVLSFNMISAFLEKAYPTPYISGFGSHKGGGFVFIDNKSKISPVPKDNPEVTAWENALKINTTDSYGFYLELFPDGKHRATAEKNIADLQESRTWELAKKKNNIDAYQIYLNIYPNGHYKKEVETAMAKLSPSNPPDTPASASTSTGSNPVKDKESPTVNNENWIPKPPSLGTEGGLSAAKSAGRALAAYNLDPTANKHKLEEAKKSSDLSIQFTDAYNSPSAWITRGDIYLTIAQEEFTRKTLNSSIKTSNACLYAYYAYDQALKIAQKKYEKSDALNGLKSTQAFIVNFGVECYESTNYAVAFEAFKAGMECHNTLISNQIASLHTQKDYFQYAGFAGLTAEKSLNFQDAITYYKIALEDPAAEPFVYEGLYNSYLQSNDDSQAIKILEQGRVKYPNDSGLLFAEINYYIAKNKPEELIARLKKAIEMEPANVGLYVTLGNAYLSLADFSSKSKDQSKADAYIEDAKKHFQQAIQLEPGSLDANYAMGSIFYNKAAMLTQELNNSTSTDTKKYSKLNEEINSLFEKALPYFMKAEQSDPNDLNTLVALKEIYSRLKKEDLHKIFNTRLDKVKNGGKHAFPYFGR